MINIKNIKIKDLKNIVMVRIERSMIKMDRLIKLKYDNRVTIETPLHRKDEQEQATWWEVKPDITSRMEGMGSYAQDINEKSIELLK